MYCHVCGFRIPDGSYICPQCESDNSAYAEYAPQAQPYQPAPAYQPTQPQVTEAYNPYPYNVPVVPAVEKSGKGFGIAAFILGAVSLFLLLNLDTVLNFLGYEEEWLYTTLCASAFFALMAIIMGGVGSARRRDNGLAIASLVIGILVLITSVLWMIEPPVHVYYYYWY